jgi:perosamine synthetase
VPEPLAAGSRIPLARPLIGEREEQLVLEVLRSGRLSLGPMLPRFERAFEELIGSGHAVAVSSGTSALHLAVRALGWGPGDEVLTSPLSFVASSNSLLYEDATPRFCDVDPTTLCIDPEIAATAVGESTAGMLPIHLFGHAAPMEPLEELAARRGLGVAEDAAQALGTICADGVPAGGRGNPAAFAFYANKQITTGEGGVLMLADGVRAEVARSERNQGRAPEMTVMEHDRLGFNYRLTDLAAALGVAQLERLDELLAARRAVAGRYAERLAALGAGTPPDADPDGLLLPVPDRGAMRRSWFVYVVRLPSGTNRAAVIAALDGAGVDARPYLPCIHLQPLYRARFGFSGGEFPIAEEFSRRALALPFYPGLGEAEVARVVGALARSLGR